MDRADLFEIQDYRGVLRATLESLPKRGWGQVSRWADVMSVNTSLVSQILRGDKSLTFEQACLLSDHLGFTNLEKEAFVCLVEWDRAGNQSLKNLLSQRMEGLSKRHKELASHVNENRDLDETSKARFYSEWIYSGIRLLTSIPKFQTDEAISKKLSIPLEKLHSQCFQNLV